MSQVLEGEVVRSDAAMLDSGTALTAVTRGEIDIQIATAHAYPRSIKRFLAQAEQMATLDEDTAATMFYVLPRGGKKIEGPSARLAEVVGSSWGNLRYGARVVAIDEAFVTAQGACHDLETNNAITVEVKRRITDKNGKRFNDDMIQVTANAACSIALRQAIFKIVPFSLVKGIYENAKQTSIGKARSMKDKRHAAVDWFKKAGATEEQLLTFLEKEGIDDINNDDLITLRGLVNAIKEGDTTIEDALSNGEPRTGGRVKESKLNAKSKPKDDAPPPISDHLADHASLVHESQSKADLESAYEGIKKTLKEVDDFDAMSDLVEWKMKQLKQ